MEEKMSFYKVIRILTLAPIMALIALTVLFFYKPEAFGGWLNYLLSVLFLTVFPLLAYPLQPIIPKFTDMGRSGQRALAIIAAVIGYIAGIVYALLARVSKQLLIVFLTYLFSGLLIALFNKVFNIRASGHACGVAGPVAYLFYIFGWYALLGLPVLGLVYWSSLKMKRHTIKQLIFGSAIPVAALGISVLITAFF